MLGKAPSYSAKQSETTITGFRQKLMRFETHPPSIVFLCNPAEKLTSGLSWKHRLPPEIMTWLIHRPRCEQLHVGTARFYPPNLLLHSKKNASTHWQEACSLGWLRQDRKQGKRGAVTCSKGTQAGSRTQVHCRASAHGMHALLELSGTPASSLVKMHASFCPVTGLVCVIQ